MVLKFESVEKLNCDHLNERRLSRVWFSIMLGKVVLTFEFVDHTNESCWVVLPHMVLFITLYKVRMWMKPQGPALTF